MSIRAFLALEISDESRTALEALRGKLETGAIFTGASVTWTRADAMHLTIKFLGTFEPKMLDRIDAALRPVCKALAPFSYGVRGLGVFPSPNRPKVIWAGVKKAADEFRNLHRLVDDNMAGLGFEPDVRDYTPHLTLGRIKSGKGARGLMKVILDNNRVWCGKSRAERLVLYQSDLDPKAKGAEYTPLRTFDFEGRELPEAQSGRDDE